MKRFNRILSVTLSLLLLLLCLSPCAPTQTAKAASRITSVIFMIGDGMGINSLRLAEQEGYTLFMEENADLKGWSRTRSNSSDVTDSAAGATALSCGVRVNNGQLCVYPDDGDRAVSRPRIITENAMRCGMHVGVVTTDKTCGATPAAYTVHTSSRNNFEDIGAQQLSLPFDLIWGANATLFTASQAQQHGWTYVKNASQLSELKPGSRSFAQLTSDCWRLTPSANAPTLAQMTQKALELLQKSSSLGFFLMVEGAHIDKCADDSKNGQVDYPSKRADTAEAVKSFDDAVKTAVEFARRDGHTLVVVTADHETGDIYLEEGTREYTFHSASHTGKDVPVFVYGADDLFAPGQALDNRDFPNLIAGVLGWKERFPLEDPPGGVPLTPPEPEEEGEKTNLWRNIADFFKRIADFFSGLFRSLLDLLGL